MNMSEIKKIKHRKDRPSIRIIFAFSSQISFAIENKIIWLKIITTFIQHPQTISRRANLPSELFFSKVVSATESSLKLGFNDLPFCTTSEMHKCF